MSRSSQSDASAVSSQTTPVSSPLLKPFHMDDTNDDIDEINSTSTSKYSIPPSILKRLTPVSPQRKVDHGSNKDTNTNKFLMERATKLKQYSNKVDRINEQQKIKVEKRRRYSNEALQQKLDSARERRLQLTTAKSRRASESLKMMTCNDLAKSVKSTKTMLIQNSGPGIGTGVTESFVFTFSVRKSKSQRLLCKYFIRQRFQMLVKARLFQTLNRETCPTSQELTRIVTSQNTIKAICFIFDKLEVPLYHMDQPRNKIIERNARVFLQSLNYIRESYLTDMRTSSLNTTLPLIKEKEPFRSVFSNKLNSDIVVLLVNVSRKLLMSFYLLLRSNLNQYSHPFLNFAKHWKMYNKVNSIFLRFHSIRSILTLNYSKAVLARSQHILQLKLSDNTYYTVRKDLQEDIRKYDDEIKRLDRQSRTFMANAKLPSFKDIYYIVGLLKSGRRVQSERDMFPTFVRSMKNWRMLLMREELYSGIKLLKEFCNVLDSNYDHEQQICLEKYLTFCELLTLENFTKTLVQEQELTEFGIRLFDFLNNSLNNGRLIPPMSLTTSNFKSFFQTAVTEGFQDIIDKEAKDTFASLLSIVDSDEGIAKAKAFLVDLVKSSIVLIINANLPSDKISFERYQFDRKFDILANNLLLERCLEALENNQDIYQMIVNDIFRYIKDPKYPLMETLQSFWLVVKENFGALPSSPNLDALKVYFVEGELDSSLLEFKDEAVKLKGLLDKIYICSMRCYGDHYIEVFEYLKNNGF